MLDFALSEDNPMKEEGGYYQNSYPAKISCFCKLLTTAFMQLYIVAIIKKTVS